MQGKRNNGCLAGHQLLSQLQGVNLKFAAIAQGAKAVAVIGAVMAAPNPVRVVQTLLQEC